MKGLSSEAELLIFKRDPDSSEWYLVEMAISGVPCIPFSVPIDAIWALQGDEQKLGEYLERQAISMIENYGDKRNPNPGAFSEYMEQN